MQSTRKSTSNRFSSPKKPDKSPKKSSGFMNTIKIFLITVLIVILVGAGSVYLYVTSVVSELTPIDPAVIGTKLIENSVIVDANGNVLEQIQIDGFRTVIEYDDISPAIIDAFIAVEDKTFMSHRGFNYVRLVGALFDTVFSGKRLGGTSTITQQLARNVYLHEIRAERSLERKIQEAYYTIDLEKYLTKEQIITAYLNLVFFGQNSNGVEAASQTYFSKPAKDVNYIEAAILAGIVKAPAQYSPVITKYKNQVLEDDYIYDDSSPIYTTVYNPQMRDRFLTCIKLMHINGKITEEQYKHAQTVDLRQVIKLNRHQDVQISSFFSDMVKTAVVEDLMNQYGYTKAQANNALFNGGLVIYSTIDFKMQKILDTYFEKDTFTDYFGNGMLSAVKSFKKEQGLENTSVVDEATVNKLVELAELDKSVIKHLPFEKGYYGEEVVAVKEALFKLGHLKKTQFPKLRANFDSKGNIVAENGKVLVYKQSNLIDSEGRYVIPEGMFHYDDAGNLVLHKDGYLNFYKHYDGDILKRIQIVVKETFTHDDEEDNKISGGRHTIASIFIHRGNDVLIDDNFKTLDAEGNVIVSSEFIKNNSEIFKLDENANLLISSDGFVFDKKGVIQPQSAMPIIDHTTGELKAIVGGRNVSGQRIYNRALNPRQPGSSIKTLTVFTPAIDTGKFNTSSPIDDVPVYMTSNPNIRWPQNWYEEVASMENYRGIVTLREALRQSMNVPAAKVVKELGVETSARYLEKFGVTTVTKEGPVNDMNIAALALGGMTRGISPLEITSAYGALANKGILNELHVYTKVVNSNGDIVLSNTPKGSVVVDENVAYIVTDMMKSAVDNALGRQARLSSSNDIIPVAGKSGTTNKSIDQWFVAYTPYYTSAVWFGNDINLSITGTSAQPAEFWGTVMSEIHEDLEPKKFVRPEGVVTATVDTISGKLPSELSAQDPRGTVHSEIFLRGQVPTEVDDVHVMCRICKSSGKLAGEFCPDNDVEEVLRIQRPVPYNPEENENQVVRDMQYDAPIEVCDIHTAENSSTEPNSQNPQTTVPSNIDSFRGVQPTVVLANGNVLIQRPYPIELMSGQIINLPYGSSILTTGDVLLPTGQLINKDTIKIIRAYTTEELDELFSRGN